MATFGIELFAQKPFHDFAGFVFGQRLHLENVFGNLIGGQPGLEEVADCFAVKCMFLVHDDVGASRFAAEFAVADCFFETIGNLFHFHLASRNTAFAKQDDVLIVADPYDTTDHNQDGYGIYPAERFLYNFTFYDFFPDEELNDMCFIVPSLQK